MAAIRESVFRVLATKIANPEGYHLRAAANEVLIEASDPRGLFYGAQTLRQLVTTEAGSRSIPDVEKRIAAFPLARIADRFGRHFFGKQVLFKIIDEMAFYKLNVLKLHLTDFEGWRLEIPAYPKLTEVGSLVDGKPQYLTTADVSGIVRYAAERQIMVVPGSRCRATREPLPAPIPNISTRRATSSIRRTRRPMISCAACSPKSQGSSPRRISISPATRSATKRGREWRMWTA